MWIEKKEIQDAISIERQAEALREGNSDDMSKNSFHSSMNMGSMDLGGAESYLSIDESIAQPTANSNRKRKKKVKDIISADTVTIGVYGGPDIMSFTFFFFGCGVRQVRRDRRL